MNNNKLNNYINFDRINNVENIKNIKQIFIDELTQYSKKDIVCTNFLTIINTYKKNFSLLFYKKIIDNIDCYLIMIKGNNDTILKKVGEIYRFPRGFPIIWIPNKLINMYGFYPKFENDKEKEDEFDKEVFQDADEMKFNFKYSGFLGQVIAFKYNNKKYWTTCAKNSSSNKFSDDIVRLVESKMTKELLDEMCKNNIYFCGETMSKNDQKHGAEVKKEELVITLVSKGHFIKKNMNNSINIKGSIDKFIEPFNQEDLHSFCMKYNLPVDNIFMIKSYNSIIKFMIGLNSIRNYINLPLFNIYWNDFSKKNSENCFIQYGNILHEDILGNVLEGIIIKVNKKSEDSVTIKYKFPFYTCRTFLLRTYLDIEKNPHPKIHPFNSSQINNWRDAYKKYLDYWVVNDKYGGKDYWANIFEEVFKQFDSLDILYKNYCDETINKDHIVGEHIFIIDNLIKSDLLLELPNFNYKNNYTRLNKKLKIKIPIIFVFGPIGGGKSTISSIIESTNPNLFTHLDGDILDLDMKSVLSLGQERNDYTKYKIIEIIMQNKIPIVSTGGGILLSNDYKNKKIVFFKNLEKIFNNTIEFDTYIFLPKNDGTRICNILENEDLSIFKKTCDDYLSKKNKINNDQTNIIIKLKDVYYDKTIINSASEIRGYSNNKTLELFGKSKKNLDIILLIISDINENNLKKIIFYPKVNNNYNSYVKNNLLKNNISKLFEFNDNQNYNLESPRFTQKRLLCSYEMDRKIIFHHITLKYNDSYFLKNNLNNDLINTEVVGKYYKCFAEDDIKKIDNILKFFNNLIKNNDKIDEINKIIKVLNNLKNNYFLIDDKKTIDDINNLIKMYIKTYNKSLFSQLQSFTLTFKSMISLIIFPELIFANNKLIDCAHITVNHGKHIPSFMKKAATDIYKSLKNNSREKTIEIIDKGISYKYSFNNGNEINVNLINIFYI